jgi:hypothetical protein
MMPNSDLRLTPTTHGKRTRFGAWIAAGLLVGFAASCATLGIPQPGSSGPPQQKGEPVLSSCVTKKIEKYSNCGEYCASINRGCQNYGCKHSADTSKSWGGMSFDNSLCSGAPIRSYQCNDPFVSDSAVECCCVGL